MVYFNLPYSATKHEGAVPWYAMTHTRRIPEKVLRDLDIESNEKVNIE